MRLGLLRVCTCTGLDIPDHSIITKHPVDVSKLPKKEAKET